MFDKLFDEAPEKLEPVKRVRPDNYHSLNLLFQYSMFQSLCQFCSKVLEELEIVINDLETQFQSGVNMVLMMGLLEGYYIPHYLWHYTPKSFEERVRTSVGNAKGFVGGGEVLLKGRKTTRGDVIFFQIFLIVF